jgi:hypothetical protein
MTMQKVYRKVSIENQGRESDYWRKQPYQARLAALEQIRREYHQWKYDSEPRLQRVYTIVKLDLADVENLEP